MWGCFKSDNNHLIAKLVQCSQWYDYYPFANFAVKLEIILLRKLQIADS